MSAYQVGGFGLGEMTYPSWVPETCVNCSSSTLTRWKSQVAFAKGFYDIWRNLAKTLREVPNPPNDPAGQARLKRFDSYESVLRAYMGTHPTVTMNPNDPFWTATPERIADFADIERQSLHHGGFTTKRTFTPGAFISKIPVVGDAVNIIGEAAAAPFNIVKGIASGERLDHVALGALKDQLKIVKDVAPYATTVVSFIPGIGTGVAMAIGAGAALAEGQSITAAAKAAIRSAIPGGQLVQAGFDAAMKVASGENVGKIALEEARSQLPAAAQKAFDIGLAVATGEKLQNALANGLASIAPGQLQTILAAGAKAIGTTPGLADAFKNIAPGAAQEGFNMAAGLLSHAGINEKALTAARSQLPPDVVQGFDAALKTQIPHTAWLANVVQAPAPGADTRPLEPPKHVAAAVPAQAASSRPLEPPKRAAGHYAPYPKKMGVAGLSGPAPDCHSLGAPITNMPHGMLQAGLSAVNGTGGRPRMVHGPDGNDYLFSLEGDALVARQCHQKGTGVSGAPTYAPYTRA